MPTLHRQQLAFHAFHAPCCRLKKPHLHCTSFSGCTLLARGWVPAIDHRHGQHIQQAATPESARTKSGHIHALKVPEVSCVQCNAPSLVVGRRRSSHAGSWAIHTLHVTTANMRQTSRRHETTLNKQARTIHSSLMLQLPDQVLGVAGIHTLDSHWLAEQAAMW